MSKLLAPNGKPSNLTPEQYKLVRSESFISWFGDWENDRENSGKVSGITKEPVVFYHSTKSNFLSKKGENIFKNPTFFFSFKKDVSDYIVRIQHQNKKGRVYTKPFFLKYHNTFDLRHIKILKDKELTRLIKKHTFYQTESDIRLFELKLSLSKFSGNTWFLTENEDFQDYIKNKGYDSFVVYEDGEKNIAVFEPNQIKLADGTNTTFDGSNPDIRFDEGGGVDYSDFKTSVIGLVKDNKVLILKRGSTANWMPNKWSLVGGVVDSGEEPKEAIIRECFEEIGLKPINVSFNHKIMTNDSGEIYYFNGELESENVKLDYENSTFKFIAKDEINNYDFVPYIKEFIIDIFSKKINNNNITFNNGGEVNTGLFSQIWGWFGIKF